ncbi:MAG: efflux RND transporter periplasmic adaptor subunit [Chromatiales bacterium]|nr:efflux RND transporter periplasmic adaptor subunit [Chromatiales bacterium]
MTRSRTFSTLVALALAASAAASAQEPAASTEVITVQAAKIGGTVTVGGTVLPEKIVNLSAQIPGEVEQLAGLEGDAFKAGDVLIVLDTDTLMAKRKAAVAGYNSALAGHQNAVVQFNREVQTPNSQANAMTGGMPGMFSMFTDPMRSMMGQGNPTYERHSNLVGQGTQIQVARDQIAQAEAAIREVDEAIENAASKAPFDGVIVKKMVEVGDIVQPGMPLLSFADTNKMQIQVEMPSRLISAIRQGDQVQARLDRGRGTLTATVSRIFPMAEQGGHTTTVKFDLPDESGAVSGMYAEVQIPDPSEYAQDMAVVPDSAIVWRGSLPAVFLVGDDGALSMKVVRIGERAASGKVSIISGLKVGDRILAQPGASTRSGPQG